MVVRPGLWVQVCAMLEEKLEISVRAILGLESEWDKSEKIYLKDIQHLIDVTCQSKSLSRKEFWYGIKQYTMELYEDVTRQLQGQLRARERYLLASSLPSDRVLEKVQRYEAHVSRQFYKAIHELQRFQAIRMGSQKALPVAVDLDVSINGEQILN